MKKTLLAAALLAGYAGAASAQSSVTLYGLVDIGYAYQNISGGDNAPGDAKNASESQFAMASGQTSGSRWGLKGVEDLGNGLKANFVYESSVTVNNGTGNSGFTRRSTLGVSSNAWGSIDLGRRTSPGTWAFSGIDPFGAAYGTSALDSTMGAQFQRLSNMIMYTSPSISGFGVSLGYSTDSGLTQRGDANTPQSFSTTGKNRALSVGLRYANGPLTVAGMFDNYMPPSDNDSANGSGNNTTSVKQWNIGAAYDLKMVKLHAAYGQNIDGIASGSTTLNNAEISGGDTNTEGGILYFPGGRTNSWMFGLTAPVGAAGSLFGSVQQMLPGGDFKDATSTSTMTVASLGYTYNLSKRTNLYGYYSYVNNVAMVEDTKSNSIGVGVRHKF